MVAVVKMNPIESLDFFKNSFPNISPEYRKLFEFGKCPPYYLGDNDNGIPFFNRWEHDYIQNDGMCKLEDFMKYRQAKLVDNFVYFRPLEVVFLNIRPGGHDEFMSTIRVLHKLNQGETPQIRKNSNPDKFNKIYGWFGGYSQDEFLQEALGIYQSSCHDRVYAHRNFQMNAAEYDAFNGLTFDRCDWLN